MVLATTRPTNIRPYCAKSTGAGVYLLVKDVEENYQQAVTAGATPVFGPEHTEWGSLRARVLDVVGYEWSFGTYEPGAEW